MSPSSKPQPPSLIQAPIGLFAGATYPFRALRLFYNRPELRGYVVVPIIVNIILGIILYVGLLFPGLNWIDALTLGLDAQIDNWIANLPNWLSFLDIFAMILGWVLRIILVLALFLIIGFILLQFGVILGSPWYGQISEKLEEFKTQRPAVLPPGNITSIFNDIWRAILFEIKKLILQLCIGLPLLLLNFIPGFGSLLFTIFGLTLTATIVCLDFLDAPLERRRLKFREKLNMVRLGLPTTASFAFICLGLITIPFINLLAIPICVASGTLVFCDRLWPYYFASKELTKPADSPTDEAE